VVSWLQVVAPELKTGDDIPDDIYQQACVHSSEQAAACCQRIGFPAMIKASWGGGGKGIRKVSLTLLALLPQTSHASACRARDELA